jgi:hypothetical protein
MAIDTNLDLSSISHLDFDPEIDCDFGDCTNTATHLAICPKCAAHEYFCTPHVEYLKNSDPNNTGTFDKSCRHVVRNGDVRFVPRI